MFAPYRYAPVALLTALAEAEKQEAAWLPYQAFLDGLAKGPIESVVDVRNRLVESMAAHPDRAVEFVSRDRRLLAELNKMIGARLPGTPRVEAEARAELHKMLNAAGYPSWVSDKIAPYSPAETSIDFGAGPMTGEPTPPGTYGLGDGHNLMIGSDPLQGPATISYPGLDEATAQAMKPSVSGDMAGRLGFERAIKKARKRRRGRR